VTKYTRAPTRSSPLNAGHPHWFQNKTPHFPRPQPQIPTNGSKINIFIIEILPVDNISAFKNYTLIGYEWDYDELLSICVPRKPSRSTKLFIRNAFLCALTAQSE
jgi:hypothetical protein